VNDPTNDAKTGKSKGRLSVFVSCAPGLEPMLATELVAILGDREDPKHTPTAVPGGVELGCDREELARVLVECGLGAHVLVRIAQFPVRELDALEGHVGRFGWSGFLRRDVPRRVRANAQRSRLYHTGAIEERVFRAIAARLGDDPPEAESDESVTVNVRMFEDRCTISMDVAGSPLHRRGYRLDPYRAPIREDLARAVVIASGWDRSRPLVDPMCGSGTLVIEAARLASEHAPGLERSFALTRTALDDGTSIGAARERARGRVLGDAPVIVGRDRDPRAIFAARENAYRAGVSELVRFEVAPLSTTRDALGALGVTRGVQVITNPPWGGRLEAEDSHHLDLRPLYGAIGSLVRSIEGASLTLAAHDRKLAYATGVPLESALLTDLGGMKVAIMRQVARGRSDERSERS
jgi:putative N6-adenine-specific DNA methylase